MILEPTTDPAAVQFGNELHVFTVGTDGNIQESVWVNGPNRWIPLRLTGAGGAVPLAPKAASNVRPQIVSGALHACYRDVNNHIQDLVHAAGAWALVPVTGPGGAPGAPAAVGTPTPVQFGGFFHCFFRDASGNIWDAFAVGTLWSLMQITGPGDKAMGAAAAAGDLSVLVLENQTHVFYRGTDGHLWDAWNVAGLPWQATKVSDDLLAGDPSALSGKLINADPTKEDVYHGPFVIYRTTDGLIRGVIYQGASNWSRTDVIPGVATISTHTSDDPGSWISLVLNGPDSGSKAPLAAGDPYFAFVLGCCYAAYYRDAEGNLIVVAIHSFSTAGGTSDNALNIMFKAYNTVVGLDPLGGFPQISTLPGQIHTVVTANQLREAIASNSWYAKALGPHSGIVLPAMQGSPCVVPIGRDAVHIFYRDTANAVHDVASHMSGGTGTTATQVV